MLLLTGCAAASPPDDDTTAIDDKPNITVVGTAAATVTPDEAQTRLRRNDGQPSAVKHGIRPAGHHMPSWTRQNGRISAT